MFLCTHCQHFEENSFHLHPQFGETELISDQTEQLTDLSGSAAFTIKTILIKNKEKEKEKISPELQNLLELWSFTGGPHPDN